jgi:DNA repair protein RadC
MADINSTLPKAPTRVAKLPYFKLCEDSGKYRARRDLTPEQIIRAARVALAQRCAPGAPMTDPDTVRDYLTVHYSDKPSEVFTCLFLNNGYRLIAAEDLFYGTINEASIYLRGIARRCLELNAAAVIIAHNHPSGSTSPSCSDRCVTLRALNALRLLDVRLLDHVIVGGGKSFSFAARGELGPQQNRAYRT